MFNQLTNMMGNYQCFEEILIKGNAEWSHKCDTEGRFPMHIACEKGSLSVVQLLTQNNCNIECEDDEQWRPIHYASMNGHIDVVKFLIDHNCNIECEDNEQWRPIHWASTKGYVDIVKLLIGNNCNIECEDNAQWRPMHWASRKGYVDIVRLLIENNCNIECEDKWQLKPIHYASIKGHVGVVKLLIGHNCNIECKNDALLRPIHYASMRGHVKIIQLLMLNNCQIECKSKDGKTPLDLARDFNNKDCVEILSNRKTLITLLAAIGQNDPITFEKLFKSCNFIGQNIYAEFSFLKVAVKNSAHKIIQHILEKTINNKEINDYVKEINANGIRNANLMKECLLYRCIIHQHVGGFKKFNTAEVINGNCGFKRPPFLEIAAELGCGVFIGEIMEKTIYNKSIWTNSMKKANEKGFLEIEEEISDRMKFLESRLKVNFTILHTAICDNDHDMVRYILNHENVSDLNSNNEIFGTALALAHSLHYSKCITILMLYQLETNTQNKYLQTPLHEAITSGVEENYEYLIDKAIDIDQTGFMGFSGLHCAVIRGMLNVSASLVNKGADFMKNVNFSPQPPSNEIIIPFAKSKLPLSHSENALTLTIKFHATLFPCFLGKLNPTSSNVHDGENNSLLHLAVKCLQPDLCRSLINAGAEVNKVNCFGISPLLELLYKTEMNMNNENFYKMIDITNILIAKNADVNVKSANGISVFQSASIIGSERLMLAILSNHPMLTNFSSRDFQLAFINQWFEYGETLIKLLPDNFLSSNITMETFQSCIQAEPKLIRALFDKSSSLLQQSVLEILLCKAAHNDDSVMFDYFIKIEILRPNQLDSGETLLTFLIKENKTQFVWKILESINKMKFLHLKNRSKQGLLEIAIEKEDIDLVEFLIHESGDLDSENNDGKTPLVQLLEKISISTPGNFKRKLIIGIKSIILLGGDIYKITSQGRQAIDACTETNCKAEIEEFYRKNHKNTKDEKIENEQERHTCNICMDDLVNIALQCGHLLCCNCSYQLIVCPLCNAEITNRIQIYFN